MSCCPHGVGAAIVTEVAGSPRVPVQLGKGDGDEEAVEVDFTPPFRRIWIVPALEERLGCRLPDINDPSTRCGSCSRSAPTSLTLGVCFPATVEELRAIVDKAGILDTLPQPHTPARLMDHLIGEFLEPECVQVGAAILRSWGCSLVLAWFFVACQPTFLCGHPVVMSPLAKATPDDVSACAMRCRACACLANDAYQRSALTDCDDNSRTLRPAPR